MTGEQRGEESADASRRRRRARALVAAALTAVLVAGSAAVVGRLIDTDHDGLPDYVEAFGWTAADGARYVTDPRLGDTDGDGLSDSQEAGEQLEESGLNVTYEGRSDPTKFDSDDDGLSDKSETIGWESTRGELYHTDPNRIDTDGDGLTDGDEAGQVMDANKIIPLFDVVSDPLLADTDSDGLSDAAEVDLSINAFDPDSDGDQLDDADEINVVGTAPDVADSDGDGLDDGYEQANRKSQGLNPSWADERIDAATYAWEFAQGAVLGEISPGDSLPWLAGNLAAGGSSFIPGVGWVIGGAADLRDAVGSAIHADWVGAGFSIAGLLPVGGDVATISAKVARFIARHPELAPAVGAAVAGLTWIPDQVKISVLKSSSTGGWGTLEGKGVSDYSLVLLQTGRINADALVRDMKRAGHVEGANGAFLRDGSAGEAFVEGLFVDSRVQARFPTTDCTSVCNVTARIIDVLDENKIARESKVGRVSLTPSIKMQIESDAYLIETGAISGAHWHFSASSVTRTLGASEPVLDLLEARGIDYTIHAPA